MAKLTAPLLSLGASGKLADTLVFFGWKGLNVVRQWVKPANPQTAAQTTQRGYIASAVSAWKNYFTNAEGRSAWNRLALLYAGAMSGFNAFTRNIVSNIPARPDASFANTVTETAGETVKFGMLNLDDGAAGDEVGNYDIWVGSTVTNMVLNESVAIAGGEVIGTNDLGDVDDVLYCKLRKSNTDRSGIFRITLIA